MSRTRKKSMQSTLRVAQRILPLLVVATIIFVGFFGAHWLLPGDESSGDQGSDAELAGASVEPVVNLTPEKEAAGKIHISPAEMRELTLTKTVPGVVKYDESTHVELRAPIDCIVTKTLVQSGQWVQAGDPLAILTSPDVGLARNDVARCEADLKLVRMEYEWAQQTDTNLAELLTLLSKEPSVIEVETQLEGKVLGDHRDELITAYSQYLLARNVISRQHFPGNQRRTDGPSAGTAAKRSRGRGSPLQGRQRRVSVSE